MPVTSYYTVNGRIIGERTAGGARVDYLSDALGNITGTVDQSVNVINTFRYKPYGDLLASTGAGSDPSFGWVGTLGYRRTARRFSDQYVRARHSGSLLGQWTTVDPLWPGTHPFSYASGDPVTSVDPTGLFDWRVESMCRCGPVGHEHPCTVYVITPDSQDAKGVAWRKDGLLTPSGGVEFCKSAFPRFKGRTMVINGTLFESEKGYPLGPLRNCFGIPSGGVRGDEVPVRKAQPIGFGTSMLSPRQIWPGGGCNQHADGGTPTGTPRNVVETDRHGVVQRIYIVADMMYEQRFFKLKNGFIPANHQLCNCFKSTADRRYLANDGGSSTQFWVQDADGLPPQKIWAKSERRSVVGNWYWMREPRPYPQSGGVE